MSMLSTIVLIIMITSGLIFSGSVLMMSPKGGLGFGVGGAGGANEYSSKKSFEFVLKRVAIITLVVFAITVLLYPYLQKITSAV